QADYRAYANVFGKLTFAVAPESRKAFTAVNAERGKRRAGKGVVPLAPLREVFLTAGKGGSFLPDPDTNRPLPARALGGPEIKMVPGEDPRVTLFEWMRAAENPFFARSFANRAWGHYFGVGVVHPVDDFSLANPPSNPKLLDALAKEFVDSKYDIRKLERTILLSRTYQLSSTPNETNKLDKNNYSHCYVRPLMAEAVVDVLNAAIGVSENFGNDAPAGVRAVEVGASRVAGQVN